MTAMRGPNTITIQSQEYDPISGLPLTHATPSAAASPKKVTHIISDMTPVARPKTIARTPAVAAPTLAPQLQHSKTLRRDVVSRPAGSHELHPRRDRSPKAHTAKSPLIQRFVPHTPVTATPKATPAAVAAKPARATFAAPVARATSPAKTPHESSQQLKSRLVSENLATATSRATQHHKPARTAGWQPTLPSIVGASIALVLLAGYLTYLNMPGLSVRVAASQAGISARFPDYRPDGYSLDGPVSYAPGEVTIKFKTNGDNRGYAVRQRSSSWDSQAVLDNYVAKQSANYLTYNEQGLTIYTYDHKAAWVNGGILYTIDGDAPLSSDQVLRIAASL
jgi:hypothetical protein